MLELVKHETSPAESPLGGLYTAGVFGVSADPGVSLAERSGIGVVQLACWRGAEAAFADQMREAAGISLPLQPNGAITSAQGDVLWVGPRRWLLITDVQKLGALESSLRTQIGIKTGCVLDLSGGRSVFSLAGPKVKSMLAKLLPLDLASKRLAPGRCAQSAISRIGVVLHVVDDNAFDLIVYRGLARHLWEILFDASLEFSVAIMPGNQGRGGG